MKQSIRRRRQSKSSTMNQMRKLASRHQVTILLSLAALHNIFTPTIASIPPSTSMTCTLCPGNTSYQMPPYTEATVDGRTCYDLAFEAQRINEEDDLCWEFYRYIGHTKCGCDSIRLSASDENNLCQICKDGNAMNAPDQKFEEVGQTTCRQAEKYISKFNKQSPHCQYFQSQSITHCNCGSELDADINTSTSTNINTNININTIPNNYESAEIWTNPEASQSLDVAISSENATMSNDYPSNLPSTYPSPTPSMEPSTVPSKVPSNHPSIIPSVTPSNIPSHTHSSKPTLVSSDSPSTSHVPSELFSQSPSISQSPSMIPSQLPSTMPSPSPSMMPSPSPSIMPSSSPSMMTSSSPSIMPSSSPSMMPSPSPSTSWPTTNPSDVESNPPSTIPSTQPTNRPSDQPSVSPTLFYDRSVNCTQLRNGIIPTRNVLDNVHMNKLSDEYHLDLILLDNTSVTRNATLELLQSLQTLFRTGVSLDATSCNNFSRRMSRNRKMDSVGNVTGIQQLESQGIKIHYVNFVDLQYRGQNYSCANNNNIPSGSKCNTAKGTFEIHYVSSSANESNNKTDIIISTVLTLFENKINHLVTDDLTLLNSITIGSSESNNDRQNSTVTSVVDVPIFSINTPLIIVAVVSSTLIAVAMLIILRWRMKSDDYQQRSSKYSHVIDTNGIVPDRHIRSDDSVSNSPTMSSGGRGATAMAGGWDDAIRSEGSQSDSNSDTSSRPSFTVQLEEAAQYSQGIEASRNSTFYQTDTASYLPSSVLKDLLDGSGQVKSFDLLDTVDL